MRKPYAVFVQEDEVCKDQYEFGDVVDRAANSCLSGNDCGASFQVHTLIGQRHIPSLNVDAGAF